MGKPMCQWWPKITSRLLTFRVSLKRDLTDIEPVTFIFHTPSWQLLQKAVDL